LSNFCCFTIYLVFFCFQSKGYNWLEKYFAFVSKNCSFFHSCFQTLHANKFDLISFDLFISLKIYFLLYRRLSHSSLIYIYIYIKVKYWVAPLKVYLFICLEVNLNHYYMYEDENSNHLFFWMYFLWIYVVQNSQLVRHSRLDNLIVDHSLQFCNVYVLVKKLEEIYKLLTWLVIGIYIERNK
jgi:hypothetical protein